MGTKVKEIEECPQCEAPVRRVYAPKRLNRYECGPFGCGWRGEPFVPEKKPIKTTQRYYRAGGEACWVFVIYDQYGQSMYLSKGFDTPVVCEKEAKKAAARCKDEDTGKLTVLIWPPYTTVTAKVLK